MNTTGQHLFATGGIVLPPASEPIQMPSGGIVPQGYDVAKLHLPAVFKALQREAYRVASDHGFHDGPNNFGERIALMHSELSEALEAHRNDLMDDKLPHRKGIEVELADALLRIFDTAEEYGLDLAGATVEKSAFNDGRPRRHGKKY